MPLYDKLVKHSGWRNTAVYLLRAQLEENSLDALLITARNDIRYLSGFSGSNGLVVITHSSRHLLTDVRYELQAPEEAPGWDIVISRMRTLIETAAEKGLLKGCETVGYDPGVVSVAQFRNMRSLLKPAGMKAAPKLVAELRARKQPEEIALMRKAARMADGVMAGVIGNIRPGMREREIAALVSYRAALAGSEHDAFDPIVVSGPRSALIHGTPSDRKLRRGDLVIIDFGCTVGGYCSDITRTIGVGGLSKKKRDIYETVRRVQKKAVQSAAPGVPAKKLDSYARTAIAGAGYREYFPHALGHGLGLDVHEDPTVSARSKHTLEEGNTITVEPGIYVPSLGGVRIEDDIAITGSGQEVLTSSPTELIIV